MAGISKPDYINTSSVEGELKITDIAGWVFGHYKDKTNFNLTLSSTTTIVEDASKAKVVDSVQTTLFDESTTPPGAYGCIVLVDSTSKISFTISQKSNVYFYTGSYSDTGGSTEGTTFSLKYVADGTITNYTTHNNSWLEIKNLKTGSYEITTGKRYLQFNELYVEDVIATENNKIFTIGKVLESNVPETNISSGISVLLTEKGNMYTYKVDGTKVKLNDPSISEVENNAVVKKSDGIYVEDLNHKITSLEGRSALGSKLEVFGAFRNTKQPSSLNGKLLYDTILFNNGDFVITNGVISGFKAGRLYEIQSGGLILNSTGRIDTRIKNNKTNQYLSNKSLSNTSIGNSIDGTATGYFDCISSDETISVEIVYSSGSPEIAGGYPYIKITEVGRTYVEDPYKQSKEDIEYGIFSTTLTGTVSANTPITLNKVIMGNMSLNTGNNGIHLKGGKLYRVSVAGAVIISKIYTPKFLIYDLTNNAITTNTVSFNPTTTATADWTIGNSGTFVTTESDIDITVACDAAILKMKNDERSEFNIIVEEVARPITLKYTPNQATFSKTTLFEGNANTISTYNLTDSVKNYDFIYIIIRFHDSTNKNQDTMYIDSDDIISTDTANGFMRVYTQTRYLGFNFTNGYDKITINDILNVTGSSVAITKIVGIRGSKSVDYSNLSDQQKTDLKSQLGISDISIEEATPLITQSVESLWTTSEEV